MRYVLALTLFISNTVLFASSFDSGNLPFDLQATVGSRSFKDIDNASAPDMEATEWAVRAYFDIGNGWLQVGPSLARQNLNKTCAMGACYEGGNTQFGVAGRIRGREGNFEYFGSALLSPSSIGVLKITNENSRAGEPPSMGDNGLSLDFVDEEMLVHYKATALNLGVGGKYHLSNGFSVVGTIELGSEIQEMEGFRYEGRDSYGNSLTYTSSKSSSFSSDDRSLSTSALIIGIEWRP